MQPASSGFCSVRDLLRHPNLATRLALFREALVKVSSVASKLTTVSAQDMIKATIGGQRDPRTLAALARGRMKAKHDDLAEALDGMFDDHHGELAQLLLDQIASLDAKIAQLASRAAGLAAAMPPPGASTPTAPPARTPAPARTPWC